ncbi:MAG: hypothetical protein RIQ88_1075 [Actinomycetota bacterium]|jgi:8-oxo-(d)GTP phosphatase
MKVLAAGAVLWRKENNELKVLLIHRQRYNDWSWPKGKVDNGELLAEAAVREIREETGLKVHLGPKLDILEYKLDNGHKKQVHYWSAEVTDTAIKRQNFIPDEEVASFEWLSIKEAKKKLSYPHDKKPLDKLVELDQAGTLKTSSLIVLRHAKATPRDQWTKGEATRPLLPQGAVQAVQLTNVLAAFGPKLVVTSSWRRCLDTVIPFVSKHKVKLIERSQLSELGANKGPKQTHKLVHKLIGTGKNVIICSHRPALPTIVEAIEVYASKNIKTVLQEITALKPGEFYVIRFASNTKGKLKVVDLEFVEI